MNRPRISLHPRLLILAVSAQLLLPQLAGAQAYEQEETKQLVALVSAATDLVRKNGEAAFTDFSTPGSRWRDEEKYIFVIDLKGNMVVHPDPTMQGKNEIELKDIHGKPIIRGLIDAATAVRGKPEGWYHYQWPVPGGLLPRWKSSFVQRIKAPSGREFVVGSGMYNDEMERAFVEDAVKNAAGEVERHGKDAFRVFRDPKGPYMFKDLYVFVVDMQGVELVNPAFANLEGRNLLDVEDTRGKKLVREMLKVANAKGSGWVDYMWPKPGESVSTQKSTFVMKARAGAQELMVGAGVYLADAPKAVAKTKPLAAPQLMKLVRDAAAVFESRGEKAYPEFRKKGTQWFQGETYFFVWGMDGVRVFHAAKPESEGEDVSQLKDVLGRPIGEMFLGAAATESGEGWVHYMWPEPGDIFPAWKSSFIKRVTFPSGKQYLIGCGIYNMEMDRVFVEDVVNRAAALVAAQGRAAFPQLRDKTGPYRFMDTYVFVDEPGGVELVNGAYPNIEGQSMIGLKDLQGKLLVREYIDAAMKSGHAWTEYYWYRPGDNAPALKHTYVKKVQAGADTFIVGSGYYESASEMGGRLLKIAWSEIEEEKMSATLVRQAIHGEKATLARMTAKRGTDVERHSHPNEEYLWVLSGVMHFKFDDKTMTVKTGELLIIPPNVPHAITVSDTAKWVDFFVPEREDWRRGQDQYLRDKSAAR